MYFHENELKILHIDCEKKFVEYLCLQKQNYLTGKINQ